MNLRVGFGYDIHPTAKGSGLRLGGVAFPRTGFRLVGHSDADVLLHAACDALLGAAGLPDIGHLFPNTASRNRGRASLEFVAEVGRRLRASGWVVRQLDCTLLAERPKIADRVPLMRRRIGRALDVSGDEISIKATTNEGLGAIGRGEGLAAFALALLEKTKK